MTFNFYLFTLGWNQDVSAVDWGREGNLPRTASEPHFTYLRQCASPEDFRTFPKQSSGKDLSFIIVNFYFKRD